MRLEASVVLSREASWAWFRKKRGAEHPWRWGCAKKIQGLPPVASTMDVMRQAAEHPLDCELGGTIVVIHHITLQ